MKKKTKTQNTTRAAARKEATREAALERYSDLVCTDSLGARNALLKLPYRNDAYLLSCIALTYRDEAMFFKNGRQRKHNVGAKLLVAKKYIEKAFRLMPDCRDLLYTRGNIHQAMDDNFTAFDCFIKILKFGKGKQPALNCSGSESWFIEMLINDAHFELYRIFRDLDNMRLAKRFLAEYKRGLKKGISTIYKPLEQFL